VGGGSESDALDPAVKAEGPPLEVVPAVDGPALLA
jgi:hypothetical protein